MQIYADVINRPISVLESSQGPALGSAIHAAVAAKMDRRRTRAYVPDDQHVRDYDRLCGIYSSPARLVRAGEPRSRWVRLPASAGRRSGRGSSRRCLTAVRGLC